MGGQIVDATVIEARRPRLTGPRRTRVRAAGRPSEWTPARRVQRDRDGRWTIKHAGLPGDGHKRQPEIAVPIFGDKNHVGIDGEHGFLRRYTVTHGAAHDGGQLGAVLDRHNTARDVWAATAIARPLTWPCAVAGASPRNSSARSQEAKRCRRIIARGNARRARVHRRVEYVFAAQKCRLRLIIRTIGMVRAALAKIDLANLAYTQLAWLTTDQQSADRRTDQIIPATTRSTPWCRPCRPSASSKNTPKTGFEASYYV